MGLLEVLGLKKAGLGPAMAARTAPQAAAPDRAPAEAGRAPAEGAVPAGRPRSVSFVAKPTAQRPEPGLAIRIGANRARSQAVVVPTLALPTKHDKVETADGKSVEVTKKANGRVVYTAPPPKVAEVTFSGGGGKGTALPGAMKALHDSGVLKDAKKIAGASVGSMTAALVAAGITHEEFLEVADADSTTEAITEGTGGTKKGMLARALKNKVTTGSGSPLTGNGLEAAVRDVLDQTLRKRITEYLVACGKEGRPPADEVAAVMKKLSANKAGPTFGDYRILAGHIPSVKEVVMTGTYTTERSDGRKLKDGNTEGQLYVFDADSEPDLEVAVAVHASASFPGAFKPIDIKLSSGLTVTFIDGGVMNNTPTSSSIGNERDLDPMPQQRGVTFVFDDEGGDAKSILAGRVKPAQGLGARIADWFVGSSNAGAEYAKNRSAADRPGEVVVVPLVVDYTDPKTGKTAPYDMRGTGKGTLNFSPPQKVRDDLRGMTEAATRKQIEKDGQARTREFASDSEMFVSIPLDELKALTTNGYAGAKEAVAFREQVAAGVATLQAGVRDALARKGGRAADALQTKAVSDVLDGFDRLAGSSADFQGYVARELNKKPDLDLFLEAARRIQRNGGKPSSTLAAADAVAEGLRAHTFADNILKQLVYPKMKHEPEGGAGVLTLLTIEQLLRTAKTPADVNQAIDLGVKHFRDKRDRRIPKRGHRRFAEMLDQRRMKPAA